MSDVIWHELALDGIPSGFIAIDNSGNLKVCNRAARNILDLGEAVKLGVPGRETLAGHEEVMEVLLDTAKTLKVHNRQEIKAKGVGGGKILLGYGTLVFKDKSGHAIGAGIIFQDITRYIPLPLTAQFMTLLAKFFLPFALIMVVSALWLGYAETRDKYLSAAILLAIIAFNMLMIYVAQRSQALYSTLRKVYSPANFIGVVGLVYLKGNFWGPMWLLHVFAPLSVSLYSSRVETLVVALSSAVTLLGIYAVRGLTGEVGWGQASLHAAFIVFISLFVNALANLVAKIKGAK